MDPIQEHFEELRSREDLKQATLTRQPTGAALVTIPNYRLPSGWSSPTTTVYFLIPVGYPVAKPDTFWTEPLRLSNGGPPQSTGTNDGHGLGRSDLTWFSWHTSVWNPNRDSLLTYVRAIDQRLQNPR